MDDVVLEYKRVDGNKTTGRVLYLEGAQETDYEKFEALTFPQMMVRFAEALIAWPEAGGVIRRNDRAGLQPYRLDRETTQLLRVDPVLVIRSMSMHDNVTVSLKPKPATPQTSPLVVGYDSIAETFGDEVYARLRADRLECPCCGVWAAIVEGVAQCPSRACSSRIPVSPRGDRWGGVLVSILLATDRDKFFLPRRWNSLRPWVSRDELEKLYTDWIKIKESIS